MLPATLPGLLLASFVAGASFLFNHFFGLLPTMVLALLIGMALNPFLPSKTFDVGLTFCVKKLLRYAIALLGLRISLADIQGIGIYTILLIVLSMSVTIKFSFYFAKILNISPNFAAMTGAANAICGASATLATASVVPDYKDKARDIAFIVMMANGVSTLALLLYPLIGQLLGFSESQLGVLIGATIQDMAQVIGAGYAVSEPVGNSAVIVKLFRVVLLLPIVVALGFYLAHLNEKEGSAKAEVPFPYFALVFIILVFVGGYLPLWLKQFLIQLSQIGMLLAIAALGLQTSLKELFSMGYKPVLQFLATSFVILMIILVGIIRL